MLREMPLHAGWTLEADTLPENLTQGEHRAGFSLPGALALADFSDLLGLEAQQEEEAAPKDAARSVKFSLPGMLPPQCSGQATLSREIDFGSLCAHRALLEIDHICGRGEILLGEETLAAFGNSRPDIALDLTDAMRLGRKQTLSIHFDDARNAGVCGAAILRMTGPAWFEDISLKPDAAKQILTVSLRVRADRAGLYAVRAACLPDEENPAAPWRESCFQLLSPGEQRLSLSLSMRAPRFEPGKPYDAPLLKLELRALSGPKDKHGRLYDARTLMTGYASRAPQAFIPLTKEECRLAPDALIARAKAIHAPALFLPAPASPLLDRRCTQEGVALIRFAPDGAPDDAAAMQSPCANDAKTADTEAFRAPSPAAACAGLCAMVSSPPSNAAALPDADLIWDAAGCRIDPAAPQTLAVLKPLRALQLSLRAEAFRQGQYRGPLCAPGEWQDDACASALRYALSPLHLSALPLRGAWWAQSHFSASLHAFIPGDETSGAYAAQAELVDHDGHILAEFSADCPARGGHLGVISALLPDNACALTLRTRLLRSGAVAESQEIPVYVGIRGPLEAAFAHNQES